MHREKKKQYACCSILSRFRIKLYLLKKYYFQTKPLKNSESTMKRYRFRSWKRKYSSKNSQTCLPAGHQIEILRMWKRLESRNVSDLLSTNCGSEAQYKGYFSCWILLSIFMYLRLQEHILCSSLLLTTERTVAALNGCTVKLSKLKTCTVSM